MTPLDDAEAQIRVAMERVPARTRRGFLDVLMLPRAEQAAAIGQLYGEDSGNRRLAQRLMAFEDDRTYTLIVADVLEEQLHDA